MTIERASPEDAATLTSIAFAAKRHWQYPESWIQRWKDSLTVTREYVGSRLTYCAKRDGKIVGFCALQLARDIAVLDHLWVDPTWIGKGVGRALFQRAEAIARASGATSIEIQSDPNAEAFYRKMGAAVESAEPAAMDAQPRFLPLLRKPLRER
jgi:GNAT superfamily N-acetyltransferase